VDSPAACPPHPRRLAAFSLIEVILAIGIVALAFIPLLGLLPTGLQSFRSAVDQTVASQIAQKIAGEAQQSDFENITGPGPERYFDGEAVELGDGGKASSLYTARMAVLEDPSQPHLKRILVQIARNPGGASTLKEEDLEGVPVWSSSNTLPVVTRSLLLARISSE